MNFLLFGFLEYDGFFYLSWLFLILGLIGAVLPVLPGPPLSWIGLLFGYLSKDVQVPLPVLVISFVICAAITIIDYICPTYITKKAGGTKHGTKGATWGLIIGLFAGPMGVIVGPFAGALIGETIQNKNDYRKALKSAFGAFLGFIFGTGLKLICDIFVLIVFWNCIGEPVNQQPELVARDGWTKEWDEEDESDDTSDFQEELFSAPAESPSESIDKVQDSVGDIVLGVLHACDF